ncbi:hypothetical protein PsAD46_01291 [Pseudovibrio sp. Ad46]|uniref:hypothetical protein n=1 Tax=unclassified Pseudovibrio TaxID=2627060 RepID=UPI0007AE8959|nr:MULTISPECIES: hypothetical protein [unclassified Pseudovibrio]KZK93621.1 hypothetical protein PsAD46_01291 [Pseudovibrio sp. Ad46]KZK95837.1 hypothetical protein PsAD5_02871 [Pseudovibrio sp. Ad5]
MQEKRNLNNGLVIVSRWQLLLSWMQRFFLVGSGVCVRMCGYCCRLVYAASRGELEHVGCHRMALVWGCGFRLR